VSEDRASAAELSVREVLRAARADLDRAGIETPRVDTELLLAHVLQRPRAQLLTAPALSRVQAADFKALVLRRAAGEPVQYLTGTAAFRHLELAVGPGVFIPRPETELIVELAAPDLKSARTVVDLCAGSGAVALAVAQEYPSAEVLAVELSDAALSWLRHNAEARAGLGDRPVSIEAGDVRSAETLAARNGQVDVVLSNPPYVPERIRAQLRPEVGHDPAEAVYAGADGLALLPELAATAARLLRAGGRFIVEHDSTHAAEVAELLEASGAWQQVSGHADLTGRPRFTAAVRAEFRTPGAVDTPGYSD
jgi:release factor glutamine methyltransferase